MQPNFEKDLIIFTDGSSRGNPGPGGYGAVLVFKKLDEVIELGGGKPETTNNEMELSAAIGALAHAENSAAATHIYTDSQYVINGITKWVFGWQKNGWQTQNKTDVHHKELWQTLVDLTRSRQNMHWHHVPGHVGVPGNERVDAIANVYAEGSTPDLYRGKLSDYTIDVLNFEINEEMAQKKESQKSSGKAFVYLSLVDGELMRHETWDECKKRVEGKKAKFRKALSPEHEQEILAEWGVSS